ALARPASFATLFSLHAPPTPAISPLSLHDALPISSDAACYLQGVNESTHGIADSLLSIAAHRAADITADILAHRAAAGDGRPLRSEEHTSELQSRENLVCRLLLEKKKTRQTILRSH